MRSILIHGLAPLLILISSPDVGTTASPRDPSPPSAGAPPPVIAGTTVVGQITVWEKGRCVIRTDDNQEIEVQLDEATFLGKGIGVGEKVLAVVGVNGHARSIETTP